MNMSQPVQYTWEDYISPEDKELAWKEFQGQMVQELKQWYGVHNPPLQTVHDYWRRRVDQAWNSIVMLDWLFIRSGRAYKELDRKDLKTVCEFHLEACLQNTFSNCDLYEGSQSELSKNVCEECGDHLIAGDYEKHCKYCWNYREHTA